MADRRVEAQRYEKLYAMLLDAIPSSVLLIDAQLRVVSANRNFLEKARRAESDTLGQRIDAVLPPLILDHMDLARRVRNAFECGEPTRGERMTYRAPALATRICYYSLIPFSWRGTVEHVMLLLEDVTEQMRLGEEARQAERHLASVAESASDLVLSNDVDGRILTWNAAAERVSGYTRDEVRGRLFSEQCSEPHRALVKQEFARARSGREFGTAEWEARQRFRLAFVDAKLPDAEGLELARRIREADPEIRIVLVSGYFYGDDPEVLQASAAGVINGFVSKPFLHDEVRAIAQTALAP